MAGGNGRRIRLLYDPLINVALYDMCSKKIKKSNYFIVHCILTSISLELFIAFCKRLYKTLFFIKFVKNVKPAGLNFCICVMISKTCIMCIVLLFQFFITCDQFDLVLSSLNKDCKC